MLTTVLAIWGSITGSLSLFFMWRNHIRDRAHVEVIFEWNANIIDNPVPEHYAAIRVTNVGRRPVHIQRVYLVLPNGRTHEAVNVFRQSTTLKEADAPISFLVREEHDKLIDDAQQWQRVYAVVEDSTGKKYKSKPPKMPPSWAKPKGSIA
jgi:hypothetical protein